MTNAEIALALAQALSPESAALPPVEQPPTSLPAIVEQTQTVEKQPLYALKGDIGLKYRTRDEATREDPERFRLNLVATSGKFVIGTREDASFTSTSRGYGADFARYKTGKVQVGLLLNKTPVDSELYATMFGSPAKGVKSALSVPLERGDDLGELLVMTELNRQLGPVGIRALYLDDLGKPRVQNMEVELSSPPVRGIGNAQITGMYKRVGTPAGYRDMVEFGVKKKFGFKHRRMQR